MKTLIALLIASCGLALASDISLTTPAPVAVTTTTTTEVSSLAVERIIIDPVAQKVIVEFVGLDRPQVIKGEEYESLKNSQVNADFQAALAAVIIPKLIPGSEE